MGFTKLEKVYRVNVKKKECPWFTYDDVLYKKKKQRRAKNYFRIKSEIIH